MSSFSQLLAPLTRPLLDKIGWDVMAKRERFMLIGLVLMVTGLLIFNFVFSPLLESRKYLQNSIEKKDIELQEMYALQQEYNKLRLQSGDISSLLAKRTKDFTLFSYIEQQATRAKVKRNIKYLKPSKVAREGELQESRVDVKMQRLSTAGLVKFLTGLESEEKVIYVNRLSIQEHGKDVGYLNVVIQVITFTRKAG